MVLRYQEMLVTIKGDDLSIDTGINDFIMKR